MSQENSSSAIDDLYSAFDMDEDAEVRGIPVNYGKFVVTLARAGGSNDLYRTTFERESKPVATALELGQLGEQESRQLLYRVYARSIVKNWQFRHTVTDAEGKVQQLLVQGFGLNRNGDVVEFNEKNLIDLWTKRHELFLQIKKDADTRELYQAREREGIAKN